jgi:hypothetical protein
VVREFSLRPEWLTLVSLALFVIAGMISLRRPQRESLVRVGS